MEVYPDPSEGSTGPVTDAEELWQWQTTDYALFVVRGVRLIVSKRRNCTCDHQSQGEPSS